jgi:hypothetical protein
MVATQSAVSIMALLLGSGVTSSVLTLIGNAGLARWTDLRRAKRNRAYSALRIAVALEEFATQCAEIVESYAMHGEPFGGPKRVPSVPAFPPDVEWRDLDIALASKALSLENLVRVANHGLASSDRNFTEGVSEAECRDFCAEFGWKAWDLATTMRRVHLIEPVDQQLPWNFPRLLELEAKAVTDRKANFRVALPVQGTAETA